jgi:hypothetical protein
MDGAEWRFLQFKKNKVKKEQNVLSTSSLSQTKVLQNVILSSLLTTKGPKEGHQGMMPWTTAISKVKLLDSMNLKRVHHISLVASVCILSISNVPICLLAEDASVPEKFSICKDQHRQRDPFFDNILG